MSDGTWCGAIIVAAGSSTRMGGVDKQFAVLAGRPVLAWAVRAFQEAAEVDVIVVVTRPDTLAQVETLAAAEGWSKVAAVVPGGARRQDSAEQGLAALVEAAVRAGTRLDLVLIHDGARPLVSAALIARGITAGRSRAAAIAAIPARDTIKVVDVDRQIQQTPDRTALWQAQTPQVFRYDLLATAYRAAHEQDLRGTDDAALLEALDLPVYIFEGESRNLKITTPEDLLLAEALLAGDLPPEDEPDS